MTAPIQEYSTLSLQAITASQCSDEVRPAIAKQALVEPGLAFFLSPSVNPRADGGHQNEKRRLNGCSPGGRFPIVIRSRERRPERGIVAHTL